MAEILDKPFIGLLAILGGVIIIAAGALADIYTITTPPGPNCKFVWGCEIKPYQNSAVPLFLLGIFVLVAGIATVIWG